MGKNTPGSASLVVMGMPPQVNVKPGTRGSTKTCEPQLRELSSSMRVRLLARNHWSGWGATVLLRIHGAGANPSIHPPQPIPLNCQQHIPLSDTFPPKNKSTQPHPLPHQQGERKGLNVGCWRWGRESNIMWAVCTRVREQRTVPSVRPTTTIPSSTFLHKMFSSFEVL